MRARLTLCTTLAVSALLSIGAGASIAQSGLDTGSKADDQQYGNTTAPKTESADVLGEVGEVEENAAPETAAPAPQAQAAAPQAVSAPQETGGELPFTGFGVVAMLLIGLTMLGGGLALRRSMRGGAAL